jgi:hypothetical protein
MILGIMAGAKLGRAPQMLRLIFEKGVFRRAPDKKLSRRGAKAGDVFVSCWAKSGTNWSMQIAQQVVCRGACDYDRLHDVVPWPESPGPFAIRLADADRRVRTPENRLVIKTHLQAPFVPYSEDATYITVVRDPKEVCVSAYWFFLGLFQLYDHVSPEEWLELYLSDNFLASMWAEHLAGYWAWRDRPNCLLLHFDEMTSDHGGSVDRIAEAMEVSLTEDERAAVIERSTFGYMKANETKFAPPILPIHGEAKRPKMVRAGRSGASSELISPEGQARIDAHCQARLKELGCDFAYAERYS